MDVHKFEIAIFYRYNNVGMVFILFYIGIMFSKSEWHIRCCYIFCFNVFIKVLLKEQSL